MEHLDSMMFEGLSLPNQVALGCGVIGFVAGRRGVQHLFLFTGPIVTSRLAGGYRRRFRYCRTRLAIDALQKPINVEAGTVLGNEPVGGSATRFLQNSNKTRRPVRFSRRAAFSFLHPC